MVVTYDTFTEEGKKTVDIGLNIKNYIKKCHVAGFVKFIPEDKEESKNDKNRQSWQYSESAVDIIKIYFEKYPSVFSAIEKEKKEANKRNNKRD